MQTLWEPSLLWLPRADRVVDNEVNAGKARRADSVGGRKEDHGGLL